MAKKRHTCDRSTLKHEMSEWFLSTRKSEHNHNNEDEQYPD
jgi:hypothetical protein